MQMPAADGLFHKGIVQSGIYEMLGDVENQDGTQIVEAILKELGLGRGDVRAAERRSRTISWQQHTKRQLRRSRHQADMSAMNRISAKIMWVIRSIMDSASMLRKFRY